MKTETNAPIDEKTTWFNEWGHLTDSEIEEKKAVNPHFRNTLARYAEIDELLATLTADDDEAKPNHVESVKPAPNAIEIEAVSIRDKLEAHANKPMSRMTAIDDYVNVWVAAQHSGGNWSDLVGIMATYEKLNGRAINKPLLVKRIRCLKMALGIN